MKRDSRLDVQMHQDAVKEFSQLDFQGERASQARKEDKKTERDTKRGVDLEDAKKEKKTTENSC
jgi:hypothetical protein